MRSLLLSPLVVLFAVPTAMHLTAAFGGQPARPVHASPAPEDIGPALNVARERFTDALRGATALNIDYGSVVPQMTAAELVELNQRAVDPAVEAFTALVETYTAEVDRALEPLREKIRQQSERSEQERALAVRIVIGEPRELGKGFQGRFGGENIYVETERYRPDTIPGTIKLGLLDGWFVREGTIEGTNALGAVVTLRKFVDAPEVEQRRLDALTERLWRHEREKGQTVREATATHAAGFTQTYRAILGRAVTLVEQESASLLQSATDTAASPTSDARIEETAAALASVEWNAGAAAEWLAHLNSVLSAVAVQFREPRDTLIRSAELRFGEMSGLLKSLGTASNPLSEGHPARDLLAQLTDGIRRGTLLASFDADHAAYIERLHSGLSQRMATLTARGQSEAGLHSVQSGLRVDHIGRDGDTVLVAAHRGRDTTSRTPAERIGVLRLRDGAVQGSKLFTVDPREDGAWANDTRALVRPLEGGWTVIQHGRWSTFLLPGWAQSVSLPSTSADHAWRIRNSVLALSGGRPGIGFNSGVYVIGPDGELDLFIDAPKDFAVLEGKIVAVTRQAAGSGSDLAEVVDPITGEPDRGFAEAWGRLIGYSWHSRGTAATIAGDRVWVFHPKGVQGVSTGPTLLPIDANGRIGTPLFAHSDYWSASGADRGAGQPVGSARIAVRGALDHIEIADGRALIYGTPRDGDTTGGSVVAFDLETGKELWVEHDIRDGRSPIAEARRRRGETASTGPAFIRADADSRGTVKGQAYSLPFAVHGNTSLVEVTISAAGVRPVTWLALDAGAYLENIEGVDAGRVLRHGERWYFGSNRIEVVRIP